MRRKQPCVGTLNLCSIRWDAQKHGVCVRVNQRCVCFACNFACMDLCAFVTISVELSSSFSLSLPLYIQIFTNFDMRIHKTSEASNCSICIHTACASATRFFENMCLWREGTCANLHSIRELTLSVHISATTRGCNQTKPLDRKKQKNPEENR